MIEWGRLLPPAFAKPRFRLFALGQAISVIGSWVQQIALSWLVYRLTGSVLMLGLTGFLTQIPHLFIAPVAGFVVDRLPRVRMLVAINLALSVLAGTMAALAFSEVTDVRIYLVLAVLIGVANACEAPTRQSLLGSIVEERALLPSAIGVNSMLFNTGRVIGPAIGAFLLLHLSEGWCFAVNAASFFAVVAATLAMRLPDARPAGAKGGASQSYGQSLRYLVGLPAAQCFLPLAATVSITALPLQHLMPSLAVEFFRGDQATLGLLMSASGVGALSGAIFLAMQRGHGVQFRLVRIAPAIAGLGLVLLGLSRVLWLSIPALILIGIFVLSTSVSTNTLLQQSVGDEWRGRVIGLYFMCFIGLAPLGNLLAGFLASRIGLGATLVLDGIVLMAVTVAMQVRLRLRPERLVALRQSLNV